MIRIPEAALIGALAFLPLAVAAPALAQPPAGVLFPEPFVVEHHVEHRDASGESFRGETVTDYYGGSWIVSVRGDGSRMIVDLAARQLTEVRPDAGTYWTIGFSRLRELRERLQRLETPSLFAAEPARELPEKAGAPPREAQVREVPVEKGRTRGLAARPGVRHLRASLEPASKAARGAEAMPALDIWVSPDVAIGAAGRRALAAFERDALGGVADPVDLPVLDLLAAVREHAAGAVPVRLRQPLVTLPGDVVSGAYVEDVVTRLERLAAFPRDLATVPEGLRRHLHPHESAIALYERDVEMGLLPR